MPTITEIKDRVLPTNAKLVVESRKSQADGAKDTGTDVSFAHKNARRNHGVGVGQDSSVAPKFAETEADTNA